MSRELNEVSESGEQMQVEIRRNIRLSLSEELKR